MLRQVTFKRENDEERMVWSEVYAPSRIDSDREFMDAKGIREMAYKFMKAMKLNNVDSAHTNDLVEGACVVESFIARKGDPDFIEGSWVVGMHIDNDDMWEKVKKGQINGFSMEAMVNKDTVEVEMTIPPIIDGKTMKAEDGHSHTFHVAYDEEGKFLGGKTDTIDGHFHVIKRGSVTEDAADHAHRFSHLEDIVLVERQRS